MQGRDVNDPVADRRLLDESGDFIRDAFQFDSIVRSDDERGGGYFISSFFGLYLWIGIYR
jgi:hypothetical protein